MALNAPKDGTSTTSLGKEMSLQEPQLNKPTCVQPRTLAVQCTSLQHEAKRARFAQLREQGLKGGLTVVSSCRAERRVAEGGEAGFSQVFVERGQETIVTICSK